ncbi:beta-lactamase family protein [bacterium]|nr:beta-lactamase family protein [bacterium]
MATGISQAEQAPKLSAAIAEQLGRSVPGLSLALVDANGLRWQAGFGLASLDEQRPVTLDTAFLWFSMTKIMTATAVMLLVQRGAVALDEPAARYLPELAKDYGSAGDTALSVRHLLSHKSGLTNPIPLSWISVLPAVAPDSSNFAMQLLQRYSRPRWRPGSRTEYGNLNYLALGEIISRASGQTYQRFVRSELLAPLGMSRSDFAYSTAMLSEAADGHHPAGSPLNPLLRLMLPAGLWGHRVSRFIKLNRFTVNGSAYGGLIGPAADAAALLRLHLSGGKAADGQQLLDPDLLKEMQRIHGQSRDMEIGLGWFRWRRDLGNGPAYLGHQGSGAGFFNQMRIYPERGIGIVLMGNSSHYQQRKILAALLD